MKKEIIKLAKADNPRFIPTTNNYMYALSELEVDYKHQVNKGKLYEVVCMNVSDDNGKIVKYTFNSELIKLGIDFCGSDSVLYAGSDNRGPIIIMSSDEEHIAVIIPKSCSFNDCELYRKGKLECNNKIAKPTFIYVVDGKYAFRKRSDAEKCNAQNIVEMRLD